MYRVEYNIISITNCRMLRIWFLLRTHSMVPGVGVVWLLSVGVALLDSSQPPDMAGAN